MAVRELLKSKPSGVVTIPAAATVGEAAGLLMKRNIGGLPVVDPRDRPLGFIAERDIVRAMDDHGSGVGSLPVEKVMHRPAPTCRVGDELQDVMARMTRKRLRHLVVLEGDGIVGVLSVGDLVKHRLEQLETEAGVLRDYVAGQRARG